MAIKNKTRYAILGVLCMKPATGYDIKMFCDKTISHFWSENFGHIYPVLKQLLSDGLIRLEQEASDDRRKVYAITDDGRSEFLLWLMEAPELAPPRSELLLKLSFGNYISKDHVIGMLMSVRKRNMENLEKYKELEKTYITNEKAQQDPAFPYWLAPLRFGILSAETAVRWCDETLQNINSR